MQGNKVHATFYSNDSKFEVVEFPKALFGHAQYFIYKDGEETNGEYNDLAAAVEAAKEESDN
jgi:hypothetical protein